MRVLIVEDEEVIAERIARLTMEVLGNKLEALSVRSSLNEAIAFIEGNEIDLLLLDLNLNNQDGYEVLNNFLSESFQTIIISAYDHRAITAFEYGVVDFIPKPFNKDRLKKGFEKFLTRENTSLSQLKYFFVKSRGRINRISLEDISYFKGAGVYTEIHLYNEKKVLHSKSLDKLILLLPDSYERVHKSYIVEYKNVKGLKIEPGGKYQLLLENDRYIPLGRTKYSVLKEKWFANK